MLKLTNVWARGLEFKLMLLLLTLLVLVVNGDGTRLIDDVDDVTQVSVELGC